jgi:hypothetical protein
VKGRIADPVVAEEAVEVAVAVVVAAVLLLLMEVAWMEACHEEGDVPVREALLLVVAAVVVAAGFEGRPC